MVRHRRLANSGLIMNSTRIAAGDERADVGEEMSRAARHPLPTASPPRTRRLEHPGRVDREPVHAVPGEEDQRRRR